MATLTSLIAEVRSWSLMDDTTEYPDQLFYNIMRDELQELVERHDIWFCKERDVEATTTANNWAMAFPDRLVRPLRVAYGTGSGRTELAFKTDDEFNADYPDGTSSSPGLATSWSIYGRTMYFGPAFSSNTTVYISGYFYPLMLGIDTDPVTSLPAETNAFLTQAPGLLRDLILDNLTRYGYMEDTRGGLFEREVRRRVSSILSAARTADSHPRRPRGHRPGRRF